MIPSNKNIYILAENIKTLFESIQQLDLSLFWFINDRLSNDFFDGFLPFIREKSTWIPVYTFIVLFAFFNKKIREALLLILALLIIILVCDTLSSAVLKPLIGRLRPCNNPEIYSSVNLLVGCGKGFSFPSSHAMNHFGLSVFLSLGVYKASNFFAILLIGWAGIIAFAQVYVGVHYPMDILFGALLGSFVGFVFYFGYSQILKRL